MATPALDAAVEWKLQWISGLIPVIQGLKLMPPAEKKKRIDTLEQEKKDVEGKDKGKAWDVAKANLERAIELADGNERNATKVEDITSWRQLIRERQKLLRDMEKEGRP